MYLKERLELWGFRVYAMLLFVGLITRVYIHKVGLAYQPLSVNPTHIDLFSHGKGIYLLSLVAILMIMSIMIYLKKPSVLASFKNPKYVVVGVMIVLIALSTLLSANREVALKGFIDRYEGFWVWTAYLSLLFLTPFFIRTEKHVLKVFEYFMYASGIVYLIGTMQYFGMDLFKTSWVKFFIMSSENLKQLGDIKVAGEAVYSTLYNPNYIGSFMALSLPVTLYLIDKAKNKRSLIVGVSILCVSLFSVIGAHSLAGILIAFFILMVVSLNKTLQCLKGQASWISNITISFVVSVLIISGCFLNDPVFRSEIHMGSILPNDFRIIENTLPDVDPPTKINPITNDGNINPDAINELFKTNGLTSGGETIALGNQESVASGRGYIWARTLPLLKQTVILGHGPDTFAFYFPQDDAGKISALGSINRMVDKPHNFYLQMIMSFGGLFFLCFIALMIFVCIELRRRSIDTVSGLYNPIFLALLCYLIIGLVNDSTIGTSSYFWIIASLGLNSLEKIESKKNKSIQ